MAKCGVVLPFEYPTVHRVSFTGPPAPSGFLDESWIIHAITIKTAHLFPMYNNIQIACLTHCSYRPKHVDFYHFLYFIFDSRIGNQGLVYIDSVVVMDPGSRTLFEQSV